MTMIEAEKEETEFMRKVENLEPIRIFVNDHVAKENGNTIMNRLNYLKEKGWQMVEQKNLSANRVVMKFKPKKRIITGV